jgi:hypothetical protein
VSSALQHLNNSNEIFLVPKGKKEVHPVVPVVDYHALRIEVVPLSDIHSCFHLFKSAKDFTLLDLNSAYHQIRVTEHSKQFTTSATSWNPYSIPGCHLE